MATINLLGNKAISVQEMNGWKKGMMVARICDEIFSPVIDGWHIRCYAMDEMLEDV